MPYSLLGQEKAALEALREADKLARPVAERVLTEAHLAHAAGRGADALALLRRAAELAHPESREAREAARLLGSWGGS